LAKTTGGKVVDREEDDILSFFYKLIRQIMERARLSSSRLSNDKKRVFFCGMPQRFSRRARNFDLRGADSNAGELRKEADCRTGVGA
jgi:hypothetical protein